MESSGLLQALQAATDSPPEQKSITLLKTKPLSEVLHIVISAIIIAPIIEELFFRGYIFRILCNKTGVITAAVLSGLFFGAIHLSLIQTCVLTCFGVIQCLLYHKTQSLIYPMLMHSVFNTIAVACVFFF